MGGKARNGELREGPAAHEVSSGHAIGRPGVQDSVVESLLKERAKYRAVFVVAIVSLLLCCLALIASSSAQQSAGQHRPRAIVLVVPHLHPEMLEAAMAGNKAPYLGLITGTNGTYSRIGTRSAELVPSLVTVLTGTENASAADLVGSTSFLRELKRAGKRPVVLASSAFWSTQETVGVGCKRVGLLDSECSGLSCPVEAAAAYCNAAEKLLSCDGKAQLYEGDVLKAFHHLVRHDGDLLYAHADFLDGTEAAAAGEDHMVTMSELSIMDGMLGKLALAVAERTSTTAESWLIILVGVGGGSSLSRAPLAMAGYAGGRQLRFAHIADDATLADIRPTLLHWYGLASPDDVVRVRGVCSTGLRVGNCGAMASQP